MLERAANSSGSAAVLHVPYTYFPDACGGTEVYVRALSERLSAIGYPSAIAAPGNADAAYLDQGLHVYRFETDRTPRRDIAYGFPDETAARAFGRILDHVRPRLVHLHARTAAVSERLVEVAHGFGAKVVLTYHTPTVSCARGTMMLFGTQACDGVLERKRCTTCALQGQGVPRFVAGCLAAIPDDMGRAAAKLDRVLRPLGALEVPALIAAGHRRFHRLVSRLDHIVAVCRWVHDVLLRNGVPAEKTSLSRQGIVCRPEQPAMARAPRPDGPMRLAYFGRVDRSKGPDLLGRALALIPKTAITLDIFAAHDGQPNAMVEMLQAQSRIDRRINIRPAVAPDAVIATMRRYDLIAIPSRWLETGPLVALEAFAAGVPVLGADLGGIAELVRDQVDGILVEPDSPRAWARAIAGVDLDRVKHLKSAIERPRRIESCADDMAELYSRLLQPGSPPSAGVEERHAH